MIIVIIVKWSDRVRLLYIDNRLLEANRPTGRHQRSGRDRMHANSIHNGLFHSH